VLSELIKWFEKRRETKALSTIQRHLALTTGIVEDLEKAIKAAVKNDGKEMWRCIERVANSEREADALRRKVMDEVSKGELSPSDREDLMDLVKRVDMIADWSRESTRVLGAIPMEHVSDSIKSEFLEMVKSVKECAVSVQKCVNRMMTKSEEALQAADAVEREEEKVDDIHEKARILLGKEDLPRAGIAVLVSQLFEAMEMIADSCEDVCDQVRVIMVRK
jgi:predicted phosphate transport protein (TIGR00153 family)